MTLFEDHIAANKSSWVFDDFVAFRVIEETVGSVTFPDPSADLELGCYYWPTPDVHLLRLSMTCVHPQLVLDEHDWIFACWLVCGCKSLLAGLALGYFK